MENETMKKDKVDRVSMKDERGVVPIIIGVGLLIVLAIILIIFVAIPFIQCQEARDMGYVIGETSTYKSWQTGGTGERMAINILHWKQTDKWELRYHDTQDQYLSKQYDSLSDLISDIDNLNATKETKDTAEKLANGVKNKCFG